MRWMLTIMSTIFALVLGTVQYAQAEEVKTPPTVKVEGSKITLPSTALPSRKGVFEIRGRGEVKEHPPEVKAEDIKGPSLPSERIGKIGKQE